MKRKEVTAEHKINVVLGLIGVMLASDTPASERSEVEALSNFLTEWITSDEPAPPPEPYERVAAHLITLAATHCAANTKGDALLDQMWLVAMIALRFAQARAEDHERTNDFEERARRH